MKKDLVNLIGIDRDEVLRYLEYKGQNISKSLIDIIDESRDITKQRINPRYMLRVYSLNYTSENSKEIKIGDTNIYLKSSDLYNLLQNCEECIIIAATLGIEIEKEIRKCSYGNLTRGIIIDACATTAIEEICDLIQDKTKEDLLKIGKYITMRYSPGYGDLPISKNKDIINLLNANREIGLTINQSGIMIPRKSVIGIIGIANSSIEGNKVKCTNCRNNKVCRYKREGENYGCKGLYKE